MPKTATPRPLTEAEKRQRYARLTEQAKREREASMSPLARMLGFGDAERGLVRDTASAANDVAGRGVMASLIGLPGDLAGMGENGLRGLLGMPQVQPWGGSEHIGQTMQDYGLVSSERRPKTELLASLISPSAAVKTAVNAPKTAISLLRMADNWDAPRTMARYGERGAIENLWHGSPHTFDRFDLSKIGTGEGAQAYGHGAYLAESPDVADFYRKTLTYADDFVDGELLDSTNPRHFLARVLSDESGDIDSARESLAMFAKPGGSKSVADSAKQAILLLDKGERPAVQSVKPDGNLYQTRLAWPDTREATDPLSPDHFLHWDKPLSEQPDIAKIIYGDRVDAFGNPMPLSSYDKYTGAMAYEDYAARMGKGALERRDGLLAKYGVDPKAPFSEWKTALGKMTPDDRAEFTSIASEVDRTATSRPASIALRELGIPGIRYLDGGSRGAGAGSHNYVVFDDRLIDIVSRNGQPIR